VLYDGRRRLRALTLVEQVPKLLVEALLTPPLPAHPLLVTHAGHLRGSGLEVNDCTRDTARMKLQATIVISYRADSFGDAGDALDDVLLRAREREDVEIDSVQLGAPASAGPVSLPYVERPPDPPRRVPHPTPNGEGS
jgi:hypothetical protein